MRAEAPLEERLAAVHAKNMALRAEIKALQAKRFVFTIASFLLLLIPTPSLEQTARIDALEAAAAQREAEQQAAEGPKMEDVIAHVKDVDPDVLARQFRLHLHRGISYLAAPHQIRSLADLIRLVAGTGDSSEGHEEERGG